MQTPNTFLVGAPKAGTTALAYYLGTHPAVFFSNPKEPQYWAKDLPRSRHELGPTDLRSYLALFEEADPDAHQIVAEGSTNYLRSKVAIPGIMRFEPDARIIVMIRNPADIAIAFHAEQVFSGCETVRDFDRAWDLQEAREAGADSTVRSVDLHQVTYRQIARVGTQLEILLAHINRDQCHVIILDDMRQRPHDVYAEVLRFLDVAHDGRTDFPHLNPAHVQRYPNLGRFLLQPPGLLEHPVKRIRRHLLKQESRVVRRMKEHLRVERPRQPVSLDTRRAVANYFKGEVALLSDLLGRDLSYWNAV